MPRVGLEITIPLSERAKTVHALDRAATVIGLINNYSPLMMSHGTGQCSGEVLCLYLSRARFEYPSIHRLI
jgi:hypothetical protein